jgi:hypothetical protein
MTLPRSIPYHQCVTCSRRDDSGRIGFAAECFMVVRVRTRTGNEIDGFVVLAKAAKVEFN